MGRFFLAPVLFFLPVFEFNGKNTERKLKIKTSSIQSNKLFLFPISFTCQM
jgi:hypothetical protein